MQAIAPQTQHLFNAVLSQSRRRALWNWLLSRSSMLRELPSGDRLTAVSHLAEQAVPLSAIVGSVNPGRNRDFDNRFAPRHRGGEARWRRIACSVLAGKPLPPVELIRLVGGNYYIVDGHHRISVAAALRHATINANVTFVRASIILKTVPTPASAVLAPICRQRC